MEGKDQIVDGFNDDVAVESDLWRQAVEAHIMAEQVRTRSVCRWAEELEARQGGLQRKYEAALAISRRDENGCGHNVFSSRGAEAPSLKSLSTIPLVYAQVRKSAQHAVNQPTLLFIRCFAHCLYSTDPLAPSSGRQEWAVAGKLTRSPKGYRRKQRRWKWEFGQGRWRRQ